MDQPQCVNYKRSRFSTRLPTDRVYTPSHFWLKQEEPDLWTIGFTKFATRMLGDFVELGFSVRPGDAVAVGQAIGSVEGFKAIADLYCVADGAFVMANPELEKDITLADSDPYNAGWLYRVRGTPEPNAVDVQGYVAMLDLTIQTMLDNSGGGEGNE